MAFSKRSVFVNFIWKFAERCGGQAISFLVSVILARILLPSDYGTIALVQVFLVMLQVFADSGLGVALIQKKEADDLDFSSVFWVNLALGGFFYVIIWLAAPWIASFYERPVLTTLVRVMGLVLPVNALRNVQQAYVSKHMIFKRFFYTTIGASVVSAGVGISMAYNGFGVWALVGQMLMSSVVGTAILWLTVGWRPRCALSFTRVKRLFVFGWKMLLSALLDTGYQQLWQLIIGKLYSPADLAFYNRGQTFPHLFVSNVNASIDSILLPLMSSEQDHRERVRNMTRLAIRTSIFVMAPLMCILAACSPNVVSLVLTDKWLPCVPFLCIFCFNYMFWPVHTANLNAIKALGRSDIFLRLEIIKKVVGLGILLYTMRIGVLAMAFGTLVSGIASQLINSWPNKSLLGYGYFSQLRDFCPSIILAMGAGGISFAVGKWVALPLFPTLLLQGLVGGLSYLVFVFVFRLEPALYFLKLLQEWQAARNR